jgi:hypothetical protein
MRFSHSRHCIGRASSLAVIQLRDSRSQQPLGAPSEQKHDLGTGSKWYDHSLVTLVNIKTSSDSNMRAESPHLRAVTKILQGRTHLFLRLRKRTNGHPT